MLVPNRHGNSNAYRYGFGGHEKDDELKGEGNHYDFGNYGYDPRLGRRFNQDPVINPTLSPYAVYNNNPNYFVDIDGQSPISKFAKAIIKQGIKKAAKEFIEHQLKNRLKSYMSKNWAKQFLKDADGLMETLDSEWYDYVIEIIPVAGDAYGGYKLTKQGKALWKKMNDLEKRVERYTGLVGKWGERGAALIDKAIQDRGKLRGALQKTGDIIEGAWQAHHLIPMEALNKTGVVQAAVSAGFDMNDAGNGLAMSTDKHNGSHKKYNKFIMDRIQQFAKDKDNKYGSIL